MKRPLLLGHRGCRGCGFEENTLLAFDYALAQGCDGFEFDVRRTRDGRNVIWHDPVCSGKEIAFTDSSDLLDPDGRPLAHLEDVLLHFGHRAYLDIELKVPGTEKSVVAALGANSPQPGFMVSSFFPEILYRLRELDPSLPLGFIFEEQVGLHSWTDLPVQVVLPRLDLLLLRPQLIEEVHQSGRQSMIWTVNVGSQMTLAAELGIDGLISDNPRLLHKTFHAG